MSYHFILPSPAHTLRLLMTETGCRPYFSSEGADKDLDDLPTTPGGRRAFHNLGRYVRQRHQHARQGVAT